MSKDNSSIESLPITSHPSPIFGPVPSRRFGISLGVDLSPFKKQCNFDCLYCELEKAKTVSVQQDPVKVADIILEVKKALIKHPNIDVITLTANGEPTLYPYLDELIDELNKIKGDVKSLILSNAGNIYNKNIRKTLAKLDIVKLSLDCISKECFKKLDRIDSSVDPSKILEGMTNFRKEFKGSFILEILFVRTLNDSHKELTFLKEAIKAIAPDRIDIGTIDRPPAYKVNPLNYKDLSDIADFFDELPVNITYKDRPAQINTFSKNEIIKLLKRRPLTQDDIENSFDDNSKKILDDLIKNKTISIVDSCGVKFYKFLE